MNLISYICFFLVSYLLLMQIFRYSTYHRFFWKIFPLLFGYSVLVAFLLNRFGLDEFFLWHVGLSFLFLLKNYRKQKVMVDSISTKEQEDISTGKFAPLDKPEVAYGRGIAKVSGEKTLRYHLMSSGTYLIVFSFFYILFYNL